ncbi:MAG: aminotransferase class III-fold pyridoxal phosphate-dependent enzyme [Pirellulaceae bacterium]
MSSASTTKRGLHAVELKMDARVAEAKRLMLAAVADHQKNLNGIRPANPELESDYQELLNQFGAIRGGNLFYPYLSSGLGNGPFVELLDGSVKLDMITGIGVHGFGHSHPAIVEAGLDAAISDTVMQGNLQQDAPSFEFSKLLMDLARKNGAKLEHCFLSTSGAMANENALKMAFQHNAPADRILAFEHCFAGRTLGLAHLTDKAAYRQGLPDTLKVDYLPFYDANDPEGSTARTLAIFDDHLKRHPGKYAVLWMEMIQGEGGYYVGDQSFFRKLADVAHQNNIAVIADEVQTFCRTTEPFAFQHFGLNEQVDLVTIGKISQVCATIFTDEYKPRPGLISQTFTGSTFSILAGQAIVKGLVDGQHFGPNGRNVKLHNHFAAGLAAIHERHPDAVNGPFGLGGMVVFTPFDGSAEKAKELSFRLFDAGLMGFVAGANPTRMRFLMPLGAVEENHIDLACQVIEQCIVEMKA